ncbi:small integral membrane protein 11B-like [Symphalangus syndactylus]|uniref:small integral membrane protein 11B-like n=1 Tax=Symphalangus syndactylus TaxID=9590 RepID=UPI00300582A2
MAEQWALYVASPLEPTTVITFQVLTGTTYSPWRVRMEFPLRGCLSLILHHFADKEGRTIGTRESCLVTIWTISRPWQAGSLWLTLIKFGCQLCGTEVWLLWWKWQW